MSKLLGEHLLMMCAYKAWANQLTFEAVMSLPESEINKHRLTNFKSMALTLNHVFVVDDMFRAHLEGRSHGYAARNTPECPPMELLWQRTQEMDQWFVESTRQAGWNDDLTEVVEFEFVGGGAGAMTKAEIVLHVVNHGTYHRGFVSDMMYQVPAVPPTNDLTVFLRDVWSKRDAG